jgi:uncharacterized SAM-binding protein YcdF (DUF218 family)
MKSIRYGVFILIAFIIYYLCITFIMKASLMSLLTYWIFINLSDSCDSLKKEML